MQAYHDLLHQLLTRGKQRADRTGVGTLGLFGYQMRFDLSEGFPLMTTKRVSFKAIAHELLWFLKGDTNIRYLVRQGVNIWNEWPYQHWLQVQGLETTYPKYSEAWEIKMQEFVASIRDDADFAAKWGELGPVYGRQWRNFAGVDQISQLINDIKIQPYSRRLIVTAWNPADIPMMIQSGLPPCHALFQFYVSEGRLSCQLYQRSADVFLGVPFNIASYALLTELIAQACGLAAGEFVHTFGDVHLYLNHQEQARLQLSREPKALPRLVLNPAVKDIFAFTYEDIQLQGYDPYPAIRAPIAV